MKLQQIPTPAFIIDQPILHNNMDAMKSRAREFGVKLRPHTKTHKTREIALMQVDDSRSITVSTLAEAEFFHQAGFTDITYAVPFFPDKLDRAAGLIRQGADLKILIDNPSMVSTLEKGTEDLPAPLKTLIKIDCGYGRAGLPPDSEEALSLAAKIQSSRNLILEGALTHAGHSYNARNREEIRAAAAQEQASVRTFSEKINAAGIPCPVTSIGSTPTATHAEDLTGVSDIRPGCYVFHDKFQADIGTCSLENCAASILAGIIGIYPEKNQLLVDAGALALSKDPGALHLGHPPTYGIIRDRPDMFVSSLSQEHGIIGSSYPMDFSRYRIGEKISIIPNHCCLAAALFPEYYVVDGGEVTAVWKPVRGW